MLVDLDTRRILAFAVSDMNGGDAAQLPVLLNHIMERYAGEGIPLKEPIVNLVVDRVSGAGSRADHTRRCWTAGRSGTARPRTR